MGYNRKFDLDMHDIALIEAALNAQLVTADDAEKRKIAALLAHIHHQKIWYRPKKGPYISG